MEDVDLLDDYEREKRFEYVKWVVSQVDAGRRDHAGALSDIYFMLLEFYAALGERNSE